MVLKLSLCVGSEGSLDLTCKSFRVMLGRSFPSFLGGVLGFLGGVPSFRWCSRKKKTKTNLCRKQKVSMAK